MVKQLCCLNCVTLEEIQTFLGQSKSKDHYATWHVCQQKPRSTGSDGGVQIIRIVRLVRFVSLLNRLYATAMAASAIILPGVTLSHTHAHFFNLLFGGAMLLNFLSCLW